MPEGTSEEMSHAAGQPPRAHIMTAPITTVTVEETGVGLFTQRIEAAGHVLVSDESIEAGGMDTGASPYDLLLAALGACTSMTLRMYANHKGWDVQRITVTLTHKKAVEADNKKQDIITRSIAIEGTLDDDQRLRLLDIAAKCPIHRTLSEEPRPVITSRLVE